MALESRPGVALGGGPSPDHGLGSARRPLAGATSPPGKRGQELVSHDREEHLEFPTLWGSATDPNTQAGFVLSPARWAICKAGVKSGKTLGCAIWLDFLAWQQKGLYGWFAPSYRQAELGFRLCCELVPETRRLVRGDRMMLVLPNGSILEFKTAEKPEYLYGPSYMAVVIDEASRMKQDAWIAIQTTLTQTRGPARIIANARGRRNWFTQLWLRAQAEMREKGEASQYSFHSMTSLDNPHVPAEEIEDARTRMPENKFRELYLAEILDEAASIFEGFRACIDRKLEDQAGPRSGRSYVAGLDFGKYHDPTVLMICDRASGAMVNVGRWLGKSWPSQVRKVALLDDRYHGMKIVADKTGVGDAPVDGLLEKGVDVDAVVFTHSEKARLVEDLQYAIELKLVSFPPWPQLLFELEVFTQERTAAGNWRYTAPEGEHDDMVWALAMANRARLSEAGGRDLVYF